MYLLDTHSSWPTVRRVTPALKANTTGAITVPSQDGSEAYRFDINGRQTATLDGVTGRTLRTFTYDAQDRISAINETDFGTTTFTYDPSGSATITGPDGQAKHVDVNADGYATKITDAAGHHQDYGYTSDGLMTSYTDQRGETHHFTWNAAGRLLTDSTPLGHTQTLARSESASGASTTTTSTHPDATGAQTTYAVSNDDAANAQTTTVTAPDGTQTATTQHRDEGTVDQTSPDGTTTHSAVNDDPRWGANVSHATTTTTLPSGKHVTTSDDSTVTRTAGQDEHDPFDFASITDTFKLTGDDGQTRTWTDTYDRTAKTETAHTPMGRTATTTYDAHDRPVTLSAPGRADVSIAYDAGGRATSVTQGTATSSVTYGTDGRIASTTDAEGGVTSYVRDAVGQPTAVTAPDSTVTHMAWDPAGELTSLTAPDGRLFSFTYDDDGEMTAATQGARSGSGDPTLTTHTGYDDAGRITGVTRASGKTLTLAYDSAGRSTSVTASDGTSISSTYEAVTGGKGGQLQTAQTDQGATTGFDYDGSLVTKVTQSADTSSGDATGAAPDVSFSYDGSLRPAAETIAGDSTPITYNDDDQPTQVGPISFGYDATTGDPTGLTVGATATTQSLDAYGRPESLTHTSDAGSGAQSVLAETLTRDHLGRITQRSVADDTGTHLYGYAYDDAGHLTQVTKDGGVVESYGYDSTGALTSRGAGLLMGSFTLDGYGRPTTTPDGSMVTWSTDGEETAITPTTGGATHFAYDGFGRLTQVTLPDGRIGIYRYDALGRRTEVRLGGGLVRRYVYGGSLWPQARIDAAGSVLERYIYGSQAHVPDLIVRRDGQRIRLVTDSTGSVRVAVDADTGAVLQRLDYDAYGRTTRDTNPGLQPFGFKGSITDPVAEGAGLTWMGVRAYQPALARFTTPEPEGLAAVWNDPDALAGDPINFRDPAGLFPWNTLDGIATWTSRTAGTVSTATGVVGVVCGIAGQPECVATAGGVGLVAGGIALVSDTYLAARGKEDWSTVAADAIGLFGSGVAAKAPESWGTGRDVIGIIGSTWSTMFYAYNLFKTFEPQTMMDRAGCQSLPLLR